MATTKRNHRIGRSATDHARAAIKTDEALRELVQTELQRLDVAARVKALREKRGLSQSALAALVGTAQPNIARLEGGQSKPTLDLLARVANALGLRLRVDFVRAS